MVAFLLTSTLPFQFDRDADVPQPITWLDARSLCNLVARSSSAVELRKTQHVYVRDEFLVPAQRRRLMARLAYTSILIAVVATCASAQAQQQRGGSAAQMMSSILATAKPFPIGISRTSMTRRTTRSARSWMCSSIMTARRARSSSASVALVSEEPSATT